MRKCELNNPADIKAGKKKGEEVLQASEQSPAVCEDHGGAGSAPAVRGRPHRNRSLCYSLWRTPHQSSGYVLKEDAAVESLCWSSLPAGTVA